LYLHIVATILNLGARQRPMVSFASQSLKPGEKKPLGIHIMEVQMGPQHSRYPGDQNYLLPLTIIVTRFLSHGGRSLDTIPHTITKQLILLQLLNYGMNTNARGCILGCDG